MSNKQKLLTAASVAALFAVSAPGAHAGQVASIYGVYDAQCVTNIDCTLGTGRTAVQYLTGTGSSGYPAGYDTPSLFIDNPTGASMTGITLTLTGYQGLESGVVSSISLPDIAAGTILQVVWADPQAVNDLFSFDYDDLSFGIGNPVGNFDVKFSATLTGTGPIASTFSPDNTQDGGNVAGAFVGWEGLDPTGTSETVYDNHNGTVSGPLAYIYTGTVGVQNSVPEPGTMAVLGAGLGALSFVRRRRKATKTEA